MFPWWTGPTEAQRAAMQAARQHELDEHEAAVQRLAEAQETGGVNPPLPTWDGPGFGPCGADR